MGKRYWVGVVEGKPHAEMCIDGYGRGEISCVAVFTKKADAAKRYEEIREVSLEPLDEHAKRLADKARIRELEAALKRIVLKDGRESIAVTKICDIARRALAGNTLGLEHPLDRKAEHE